MSSQHTVQTTGTGVAPVTTAETVVLTIVTPPENQVVGDGIALTGTVEGTTGASTTAVAVRVRIGTVTGTVVGDVFTSPATASALWAGGFDVLDPVLSYPNGQTYVVTVQQTSATTNGSGFVGTVVSTPSTPLAG
jgi:hypothetical protein